MVAEDHADSRTNAAAIYNVIRDRLVATNVSSEYKLPLVYVIDSILKNVRGEFIPVIELDVKNWLPIVYQALPDDQRVKLKKVWNLWKDAGVFEESKWREMGRCFSDSNVVDLSSDDPVTTNPSLVKAGITWGVRGNSYRISFFYISDISELYRQVTLLVTKTLWLILLLFVSSWFFRKMGVCF